MKVVFWSNYPDSGVTSNMTAIGVMISLIYHGRLVMLSNHYNQENLGRSLLGETYDEMLKEECNYFANGSAQNYIKQLINRSNRRQHTENILEVIDDGLYYYVDCPIFNSRISDMKAEEEMESVLEYLKQHAELIFIDAKSQESLSTKHLLESADIVVVNLRQEETAIRNFFKRYSSLLGKCVFVLSAYQKNSGYMKKRFVHEFRIHPGRVAVIPFSPIFHANICDGRIVEYITENAECKKDSSPYEYIWHLKKAATMLMNNITDNIQFNGENGACVDI